MSDQAVILKRTGSQFLEICRSRQILPHDRWRGSVTCLDRERKREADAMAAFFNERRERGSESSLLPAVSGESDHIVRGLQLGRS